MELPVVYLVIIILVAAVFFWVTLQSRQGPVGRRPPGRQQQPRPRLETQSPSTTSTTPRRDRLEPRGTTIPGLPQQQERQPAREVQVATAPRSDTPEETRLDVHLDWSAAQNREWQDRSAQPLARTAPAQGGQSQRRPTAPVLPSRSWRIAGKRARPEMLSSPRAAHQAFLAMELLRPPLALRKDGEDAMSN